MPTLEGLLQITERRPLGPFPSFDKAHLLLAFLIIGERGSIGRHALATSSGLGEGAIRTVIKRLRDEGFVAANPAGCHLTPAGKRVYATLTQTMSPITVVHGPELTVGAHQAAIDIRNGIRSVTSGIEQRDAAIKVGAAGATTYLIRSGKFTIPRGSNDCELDFPGEAWKMLRKELGPKEGDSIVLCGAETPTLAALGAVAAAITML
jgi:hypothetical protein